MASSIRARSFCCFLPSVIGVLALSFVWIIGGTLIAITAWSQVLQLEAHPIPHVDEIALYFHCLNFTLLGVIGIVGVAAASLKRSALVLTYLLLLEFHILLSFGTGIFTLYTIFRVKPFDEVFRCLNGATDPLTMNVCMNGVAIFKGVAVAIYIVSWILEIYAWFMAFFYRSELKALEADPELESNGKNLTRSNSGQIKPGDISDPRPVPNFKPSSLASIGRNYPISIIDSFGTVPRTDGHVGALTDVPLRSTSPPTTPVTGSKADIVSGIKPFLLSQPNSASTTPHKHVDTADISSPAPLTTYNSAGAAGLNNGYAFSTVAASFGSDSRPPPPGRDGSWTYIRDGTERS